MARVVVAAILLFHADALLPARPQLRARVSRARIALASSEQTETPAAPLAEAELAAGEGAPAAPPAEDAPEAAKETVTLPTGEVIEVEDEDIIQRYVKQRDDWWSDGLFSSPLASKGGQTSGPISMILDTVPLPSYFFLLTSSVVAIAFVGCIFQVFFGRARV